MTQHSNRLNLFLAYGFTLAMMVVGGVGSRTEYAAVHFANGETLIGNGWIVMGTALGGMFASGFVLGAVIDPDGIDKPSDALMGIILLPMLASYAGGFMLWGFLGLFGGMLWGAGLMMVGMIPGAVVGYLRRMVAGTSSVEEIHATRDVLGCLVLAAVIGGIVFLVNWFNAPANEGDDGGESLYSVPLDSAVARTSAHLTRCPCRDRTTPGRG